jgi:hypothetical protein
MTKQAEAGFRRTVVLSAIAVAACSYAPLRAQTALAVTRGSVDAAGVDVAELRTAEVARARLSADVMALQTFRPAYTFWRHIFAIPDGSIAFGSAEDGRLLAVFPAAGDWTRTGRWLEPSLMDVVHGQSLPRDIGQRREQLAALLGPAVGAVVSNPTRGRFLLPNVARYGEFLDEWAAIYERFGVPAEIGLAQAIIESGLNGAVRSEARAIGFCQWLESNWKMLDRLAPHVIEAKNQTTQAAYCAAYLTILATKYGSFVPALSEHHAGGTNVGRTLINGERLGGGDVVSRYFLGSEFALAAREPSDGRYRELYRSYGPRSYRYSELVFGNIATVQELRESTPQTRVYAMRTTRAVPLSEVTKRTGLSAETVRRYNPALVSRVPARATLYLPTAVAAFGRDVSFWHRPPSADFAAALADFMTLDVAPEQWDEPAFARVLREYQRRFEQTGTEEGSVMATVLAYVGEEIRTNRRGALLREFRESEQVRQLFEQAVRATAVSLH